MAANQSDQSHYSARRALPNRTVLLLLALAGSLFGLSAPAQAQAPCSGAPGERVVGSIPQGNGIADIPLCVNDGSAPSNGAPPRPMYREPPPPKGWQPRYGAFMKYPVWIDRDNSGYLSGYALAINHPSPQAAQNAVLEQCQREALPRERNACKPDNVSIVDKAYVRLSLDAPYGFTLQTATQLKELIELRRSFTMANGPYEACSASTPAGKCYDSLLALARNGIHRQPFEKDLHGIAPCPSGPTDPEMKIIGSDGESGTPVPLCGPDWDKRETRLRGGRYDGFAVHPRLSGSPFVSPGHADAASAERGALALCSGVFGTGCRSLGAHVNGFAATALNDRGELFLGRGPDKASAIADAHRACDTSPGQIIPCDIIALRMAGLPYPRIARLDWHGRTFGAAAAPGGAVSQGGKAWISRGMPSLEEAERYALQHCAQANASGPRCKILVSGLNVSIVSWVGTDGSAGVLSSLASRFGGDNDERIKAIMNAICAPRGALCKDNYSQSAHFGQPGLDTLLIGRFES